MEQLKIGYARADFSPDKPVRMNSQHTGEIVKEPICATALYLTQGDTRVLVIGMDVRNVYEYFAAEAKKMVSKATGVPEEAILFHTPHNHSSPDCSAMENETVIDWRERIGYPGIVRAAKAAVADAKPVTGMTGGRAVSEKLNFVRRYQREDGSWVGIATANPSKAPIVAHENEADMELRAVRITRNGGKDIILVNYQTHAAGALGQFPTQINADFVGPLRDKLEKEENALVLYLQGACGNTNYKSRLASEKPMNKEYYWEIGESLADTARQALAQAQEMTLGTLKLWVGTVTCTVNHIKDHLAQQAEKIAEVEDPDKRLEMMHSIGIASRYERGAIIKRSGMPATEQMELAAVSIGDFAMAFNPVEMFDTNGVQLRKASPFAITFPCSYSLNYRGYMPSHQAFPHGEYEAYMCNYLPGTGENIVLALLAALQDMKNS